jgi:hypothetical protein
MSAAAAERGRRRKQRLDASAARIKAMSNPLRARIFQHFIEHGVKAPVEVHHELRIELHKASYHCRKLQEFGFLELVRTEAVRGSVKHYLRATERQYIDAPEWEDLDPLAKESHLALSFQSIVSDVQKAVSDQTIGRDGDFWVTRIPVRSLDDEGFAELLAAHRALFDETYEIERRSAERLAESGGTATPVSTGQTCFRMKSF